MEQINYQSFEPEVGYKPKSIVDYISALDQQNARFERDEKRASAVLNLSDSNQRLSAKIKDSEMQQLAQFSQTMTEKLVEQQKEKNKQEMMRGINDAYLNGTDTTGLKEGEQQLKAADSVIQTTANSIETQGGDFFAAQEVRRTSGWYQYGQAIGMVRQGAASYPAFFEEAKENVTINIGGRDVNLNNAETPSEHAAVMATIRQGFLEKFAGVNPEILDEYLFKEMQGYERQVYTQWAQQRAADLKEEGIDNALNDFSNGVSDINTAYQALVNSGVSKSAAKKYVLEQALLDFKGGSISEEQYNAILDSPFGPGGTWRSGNRRLLADIEKQIVQENIDDSNRAKAEANVNARDQVDAVLQNLPDGEYTDEQLDEFITQVKEQNPLADAKVFTPLEDYRDNHSMQARDRQEQAEVLDALYLSGELSVAELRSGKYSPEVASEYMGKAQQNDNVRRQIGQAAAASPRQQKAVENAILRAAGLTNIDNVNDPSILFAIDDAMASLQSEALKLMNADPNMTAGQAYTQAGMALVAEIQAGVEDPNSQWYVDRTGTPGSNFMPNYTDKRQGASAAVSQANQQLVVFRDLTMANGEAVLTPDIKVFTEDEVKALSNPNNPATRKLHTIVNTLNSRQGGKPITLSEARQQLVENFGLKMERPFERDAYEDAAVTPGLEDALTMNTAAKVARVSEQGGLPNLQVREGQQGARDVLQVSLKLGAPPQIAPLAAAVFANETGWGKYTSGQNNLFNIKSTDGTGTTTTTLEGDINGGGGVPTKAQWRDYGTKAESVKDFWEFLETNPRYAAVLTASTPMEALRELKKAGYATSPTYVQDVARTFKSMGINPNQPYESTQLTSSPWGDTRTMSPTAAVYITGNIGPTSTGPHLDVKRVDKSYFDYDDLDGYVYVEDPELGTIPLSGLPETGDWRSHTSRGSHGRDYGTFSGTEVFIKNGAKVVSSVPTEHGDYMIIELPNGVQYSFLHGKSS